jgi:hypothetical protein
MALSFDRIKDRAQKLQKKLARKTEGPKDDILRDNLEEDNGKGNSYTLSAVINDIKKNWADIKKLNKFF